MIRDIHNILTLEDTSSKKIIIILSLVVFLFTLIFSFFSTSYTLNGEINIISSLGERMIILRFILLFFSIFLFIYFMMYYPLRIQFQLHKDGSLDVTKRDWFFRTKHYHIEKSQHPYVFAKKRRLIGPTIYLGAKRYQTFIIFTKNNEEKKINFLFTAAFFMRGMGPKGVLTKEEVQTLAQELKLKVIFEE